MKHSSANIRLFFGIIFALAIVVGTAYLQMVFRFSTYVALAICIIVACLFFWIVNGSE